MFSKQTAKRSTRIKAKKVMFNSQSISSFLLQDLSFRANNHYHAHRLIFDWKINFGGRFLLVPFVYFHLVIWVLMCLWCSNILKRRNWWRWAIKTFLWPGLATTSASQGLCYCQNNDKNYVVTLFEQSETKGGAIPTSNEMILGDQFLNMSEEHKKILTQLFVVNLFLR